MTNILNLLEEILSSGSQGRYAFHGSYGIVELCPDHRKEDDYYGPMVGVKPLTEDLLDVLLADQGNEAASVLSDECLGWTEEEDQETAEAIYCEEVSMRYVAPSELVPLESISMEFLQKVFSGKRLLAYWGGEVIREDRWSFELEPLSSTDLLVGGLFPVSLDEKGRLVTCQGKDRWDYHDLSQVLPEEEIDSLLSTEFSLGEELSSLEDDED